MTRSNTDDRQQTAVSCARADLQAGGRRVWVRGGLALAADAFVGTVNIVNGVHQAVTGTVTRLNPAARPIGLGIGMGSDFVYGRVRDIGRLSFFGVSQLAGLAETLVPARKRDIPERLSLGLHSAVNGAFGDYLERSGNELALSMAFVADDGRPISLTRNGLSVSLREPSPRLVVMIHGLGMNDRQWRQGERPDFGARLTADLGYSALRLRYNSGRHISSNGRDLARLMQSLFEAYPVAIERLTIVGHSMGGLVARSACHYARQAGHTWVDHLADLICLGSPHLGAPLERLGNRFNHSLTRISYTRPFAALGDIRSAGVKDLSHGYLRDEDWQKDDGNAGGSTPAASMPTLDHVGHFLVAATLGRRDEDPLGRWLGDLLVPVRSAVGHSSVPSRRLSARDQDGRIFYGMNHFALMHHDDVYAAILDWLAPRLARASRADASRTVSQSPG
ncbi:esterase/lipase family protein [Salinisphaera aquimarina]|uniref:Esterase/lipase family protein n=1 Tax=Salinisphaera aquimarina TaxID=2094031 RepID=A0ABV7EQY4_9GAMM